ncbi:aldehyde dehydrogenase family protein [uncultured Boseongicola sp.]|jgi:aldehyde dehydrogenase (NAD+)|uniref:aldehyde dehydrogenase family protein n=1 Tax=uncultured Boseongicola sp. TaxID=1648499 RepID=UPI00263168DA|nr:aldehyde dehydrogenase family protein [uncultured Boseongicola sp.]
MIEKRQFYINGSWVDPIAGKACDVIDPSTEEAVATISLGGQADTDAAVAAAKAALPAWRALSVADRIAYVRNILEVYTERQHDMAKAMSLEMGAPIDFSLEEQVSSGDSHIRGFLKAVQGFEWEHRLNGKAGTRIIKDPIGVVGMITPWNWPMNQVTLKAIPALITGCTMVLKPSEIAPLSSLLFAEIVDAAGVPAGVFNLVNGDGVGVGSQLSVHPDVDMISFTGSTRAGIAISKAAAETLKRVSLELGGKGANIVFADADDDAVQRGARHCFENTGQSCNAPTRMLVERSRYERAVEEAAEIARNTHVAKAAEKGAHIGPLVSELQFNKVQSLIQSGLDEGARLAAGGVGRPDGLNRGYFVCPTVFADVTPDMTIMREEIFGPVLSIMPFDTADEALAIANDTVYGLTNYVQSSDPEKLKRFARELHSGMVQMNGQSRGQGAPFGGVGHSGNGREGGVWGLEEFVEIKSVGGWPD